MFFLSTDNVWIKVQLTFFNLDMNAGILEKLCVCVCVCVCHMSTPLRKSLPLSPKGCWRNHDEAREVQTIIGGWIKKSLWNVMSFSEEKRVTPSNSHNNKTKTFTHSKDEREGHTQDTVPQSCLSVCLSVYVQTRTLCFMFSNTSPSLWCHTARFHWPVWLADEHSNIVLFHSVMQKGWANVERRKEVSLSVHISLHSSGGCAG